MGRKSYKFSFDHYRESNIVTIEYLKFSKQRSFQNNHP